MSLSKEEINKIKSNILKRDLFIYQNIENRMRKLETKEVKVAYFNQLLLARESIELSINYAKKHTDAKEYKRICEIIQGHIGMFILIAKDAKQNIATFFQKVYSFLESIDASNAFNDDEKSYLCIMMDRGPEERFIDANRKYLKQYSAPNSDFSLTRNIALRCIPSFKKAPEESNKNSSCKKEISDFFITLSCPINKAECESLQEEVTNNRFITLLEPELWELSFNKTAYVKIDFSQPIDVIIEVIKNIKTIIEQDKHNTITPSLYEAYSGEQVETFSTSLDEVLKKRNTLFSLEEKLTDIIYIYDCKKVNIPDIKIRDNLFDYYQDKKVDNKKGKRKSANLYETLRTTITNYKKVLERLNPDFSPFD